MKAVVGSEAQEETRVTRREGREAWWGWWWPQSEEGAHFKQSVVCTIRAGGSPLPMYVSPKWKRSKSNKSVVLKFWNRLEILEIWKRIECL